LMDLAHGRERSAKAVCRARGDGSAGARSAFDFAILTSGGAASGGARPAPLAMGKQAWEKALHAAPALRRVPTPQRPVLAERWRLPAEEFDNLLRYQVARSEEWQAWLRACDVDWRDRAALREHVARVRIDLLDLLPSRATEEPRA